MIEPLRIEEQIPIARLGAKASGQDGAEPPGEGFGQPLGIEPAQRASPSRKASSSSAAIA